MKTIYGAKHCTKCQQLKKELEEKGEKFKYIDIESMEPKEVHELAKEHGMMLPIVKG